jgi:hypothetical protein
VYHWVARELAQHRLGLAPEMCRLYRGKGYHSRDRGNDIIVDISIEVWQAAAETWSLLWVYECKDYSGSVSVGKVEEFKAKLDQISSANRKGILVLTGQLQDGALNYAKTHGIAIVRMPADGPVVQPCHLTSDHPQMVPARFEDIAHYDRVDRSYLLKLARWITRDRSAAEDIVQDTLVRLMTELPENISSIRARARRIVEWKARKWLSEKKKMKEQIARYWHPSVRTY